MRGITHQELANIHSFIDEHHRFGKYKKPEDRKYKSRNIKYVDIVYDTRTRTFWSIGFRNLITFKTTDYAMGMRSGIGKRFNSLYELIMAFLTEKISKEDL